ncbi:hypothetical protein C8F04DRAFT_1200793 [Mycena alexandri]|uniref:DEAD/DEAH box helicase domain-containing protein n=1 Tax=Mycena alexandri TaxID=1745969 RepID=A0AAD6RXV7_9AGAR|nr:hypothetical protein C8F04DRAFT_1200793 [Mycena alexandri]
MSESALGCAQNSDGSLRDTSEIQWFNDRDDEAPTSGPSSSPPLHPIFTSIPPLRKVAGARCSSSQCRSSRQSRPSARAADPNNVEGTSGKRKAEASSSHPPKPAKAAKRVVTSDSSDGESDVESNVDVDMAGDATEGMEGASSTVDAEEYTRFKAMGDADHAHATAKAPRSDLTADVNTVFKRVKGQHDPETGARSESGAICLVCTRKSVKASLCFLKGSVTTLRKPVGRHKDHFNVYKARCEELGIALHPSDMPKAECPELPPPSTPIPGVLSTRTALKSLPNTPMGITHFPRTPLSAVPNRKLHRNGYETAPKTPSYIPFALNNIGHPRQKAFTVDKPELLRTCPTLDPSEWTALAIKARAIPAGAAVRGYQVQLSNLILRRGGDAVVIAPTGSGKSLTWTLPLLARKEAPEAGGTHMHLGQPSGCRHGCRRRAVQRAEITAFGPQRSKAFDVVSDDVDKKCGKILQEIPTYK